ncbi:MAG: DUF91 domain-containing protein [bacterium]|jgi:hypothetical protein
MPRFDIPTWQMILNAVHELGGCSTPARIIEEVLKHYPEANVGTIRSQIRYCTVNANSRVDSPQNQSARDHRKPIDVLYQNKNGEYELYTPTRHGLWGINRDSDGVFSVYLVRKPEECTGEMDSLNDFGQGVALEGNEQQSTDFNEMLGEFQRESQLRDFLAASIRNTNFKGRRLELYQDSMGRNGLEYQTPAGRIDILAVDSGGNYVVFELKLSRGRDCALGQLQRYMGWIRRNLAGDKAVSGIIVADLIDQNLRYAASEAQNIELYEYKVSFTFDEVGLD